MAGWAGGFLAMTHMRRLALSGVLVLTTAIAPTWQQKSAATAQKTNRAIPAEEMKFLPAGPFLFAPGAIQPTYMDWVDKRPLVESPDGSLGVTVTGPKESWGAWVTISPSAFPDGPVQVWPIQRSVDVLWRPDSRAFALTDNRYANNSYVLLFGTEFHMGESDSELGIPMTDVTPIVRKAFEKQAKEYYAGQDYDTLLFYAKALRWFGYGQILIGVSARTEGPTSLPNRGIKDWAQGYLVDVPYSVDLPDKKVVRELSEAQLLSQYGIRVAK